MRQLEKSRNYAEEKGLLFDDSLTIKDLGLSAFSGKHRRRGALGEFLKAVQAGRVPRGSFLVVESLDRLSREKIMTAFDQLRKITSYGITVVSLMDRMEYTHETWNANINMVYASLGQMFRSYDESNTKSIRHTDNWEAKRKNIAEKKLTALAPAWLKLNENKDKFEEIEDRVKLVRRIFNLSLQGIGAGSIAKMLNKEKILGWKMQKAGTQKKPDTGWHPSYIQKILHSQAVLGKFEPHYMKKDEEGEEATRTPTGVVIEDYFPRIISDEVFYRVQERLRSNKNFGGKNGKLSNLFGRLANCGYCGSPMQFVNKGKQNGMYLVCDSARRGRGCDYNSYPYQEFEDAVLSFCAGLKISDLLSDDAVHLESKLAELQGRLAAIGNEFDEVERRIKRLVSTLSAQDDKLIQSSIKEGIAEFAARREAIVKERAKIMQEITELMYKQQSVETSIQGLKELKEFAQTAPPDKLVEVRQKLRGELRQLIARIDVFPVGHIPAAKTMETVYDMEVGLAEGQNSLDAASADEAQTRIMNYYNQLKDKKRRHMIVRFRNEDFRMLVPSADDPRTYQVWTEKERDKYFMELDKLTN
jgi:DNA invertase Pin-like site-specific DNA recombinase